MVVFDEVIFLFGGNFQNTSHAEKSGLAFFANFPIFMISYWCDLAQVGDLMILILSVKSQFSGTENRYHCFLLQFQWIGNLTSSQNVMNFDLAVVLYQSRHSSARTYSRSELLELLWHLNSATMSGPARLRDKTHFKRFLAWWWIRNSVERYRFLFWDILLTQDKNNQSTVAGYHCADIWRYLSKHSCKPARCRFALTFRYPRIQKSIASQSHSTAHFDI